MDPRTAAAEMREGGVEGCVEQCKWLSTWPAKILVLIAKKVLKPTKYKQVFKNSFDGLSAARQSLGRKSAGVGTYT